MWNYFSLVCPELKNLPWNKVALVFCQVLILICPEHYSIKYVLLCLLLENAQEDFIFFGQRAYIGGR